MATARALDVTELLVAILCNLQLYDLFRIRRFSKKWRDTVSASYKLRQILFLEPSSKGLFRYIPPGKPKKPITVTL